MSAKTNPSTKTYVVGVGSTAFRKPGAVNELDYPEMVQEAVNEALVQSQLQFSDFDAAFVSYVYGESTSGQRALSLFGQTGIPVVNVNNNCASGSSALYLGIQGIQACYECVLVVGFEKMQKGSLSAQFPNMTHPLNRHVASMADFDPKVPFTVQAFAYAGREHMSLFETKPVHFAKIAEKNHRHSVNNPKAQFQKEYTLDEIVQSRMIIEPLTLLQCSSTSNGASAVIFCNEIFAVRHGLTEKAVEVLAMELISDVPETFGGSAMALVGYHATKLAAERIYKRTGYNGRDVQVVELHDCFSTNELITYEALGLCLEGGAVEFIENKENTYGGRCVVNPSGGLISKGHPLGATGVSQCAELFTQLCGMAGPRQVDQPKLALQHNIALGGAVVVALYKKGFLDFVMPKHTDFACETHLNILDVVMRNYSGSIPLPTGIGLHVWSSKSGIEGWWLIDGARGVSFLSPKKTLTRIEMKDEDVVKLFGGKLQLQGAFFAGNLKIRGDVDLAFKLDHVDSIISAANTAKL